MVINAASEGDRRRRRDAQGRSAVGNQAADRAAARRRSPARWTCPRGGRFGRRGRRRGSVFRPRQGRELSVLSAGAARRRRNRRHRRSLGSRLMQIARVVGTVVSTQKNKKFEAAKLLLVQPVNVDDTPRGTALLAIDGVGAGVNEKVLVVLEGRAAGEALGKKAAPVDAAIIGIIDQVDVHGDL